MKIAGIIAEYNPFHNGHLYQIEKTKKELGIDFIVAVMSGDFVMRGEPALYNKFLRAKMAAENGVDLVIELPAPYALSSAEFFAEGSVKLLNSLNIVDYLSFGSESGNIEKLKSIAEKLNSEKIKSKIIKNQKKGIPVYEAISEEFSDSDKEILKTPNNILAINYIKALLKTKSKITPYTLERIKTGYNDLETKDGFASATGIRERLRNNEDISPFMPKKAFKLSDNVLPVFEEEFDKVITYILRVKESEELLKYPDVSEGLENLIAEASRNAFGVKEVAEYIKSKRYTYTRIKRILFNILCDIKKEEREKDPQYARVLAFNENGKKLIGELNKKSLIPVITNPTKEHYEKYPDLLLDLKVHDIYSIICGNKGGENKRILL
ncbi:MAG: nucleotidyltransferase [Clostridia bacterium]|nr:nucleotidyltransferase [Clostridia bacterium]